MVLCKRSGFDTQSDKLFFNLQNERIAANIKLFKYSFKLMMNLKAVNASTSVYTACLIGFAFANWLTLVSIQRLLLFISNIVSAKQQ